MANTIGVRIYTNRASYLSGATFAQPIGFGNPPLSPLSSADNRVFALPKFSRLTRMVGRFILEAGVLGAATAHAIGTWANVAQHLAQGRVQTVGVSVQSLRTQALHNAVARDFGLGTQSLRTSIVQGGRVAASAIAAWALQAQHLAQGRAQGVGLSTQSLATSIIHAGRVQAFGLAVQALMSSVSLAGVTGRAQGVGIALQSLRTQVLHIGIVRGIMVAVSTALGIALPPAARGGKSTSLTLPGRDGVRVSDRDGMTLPDRDVARLPGRK